MFSLIKNIFKRLHYIINKFQKIDVNYKTFNNIFVYKNYLHKIILFIYSIIKLFNNYSTLLFKYKNIL